RAGSGWGGRPGEWFARANSSPASACPWLSPKAAVRSADLIGTITAFARSWRARRAVTARRGSRQRSDSRRPSARDGRVRIDPPPALVAPPQPSRRARQEPQPRPLPIHSAPRFRGRKQQFILSLTAFDTRGYSEAFT